MDRAAVEQLLDEMFSSLEDLRPKLSHLAVFERQGACSDEDLCSLSRAGGKREQRRCGSRGCG
jgi:hypothetical protein